MLSHYFAVALRKLRSAPVAAAMNVLTLALGLACFVAVYAFVAFWGSAERQFAKADRIAVLTESMTLADNSFSYEDEPAVPEIAAQYLKSEFPGIEKTARAVHIDGQMVAAGGRALHKIGVAVDPQFLELFELPFVAGDPRTALARPRSAVLTQDLAVQLFGSAEPLGQAVRIGNTVDATVTGVLGPVPEPSHMGRSSSAPLKFDFLASFDVLEAIRSSTAQPGAPPPREHWDQSSALTYVLLPEDGSFTLRALRAQLPSFTKRHVPPEMAGFMTLSFDAESVRDVLANAQGDGLFLEDSGHALPALLLAFGGLVLALACVNYANLATARAAGRAREVGLRRVLGARRSQIAAQHLLEAGLLTTLALGVALAIVRFALPALGTFAEADLGPTLFDGARFFGFVAVVIGVVTVAAGAYPAVVLARVRPVATLHASRTQLGSKMLSTLLIGVQFAAASFLLIALAIAVLENQHLRRTGLAANADPLVLIENDAKTTKVESKTLRAELERVPEVKGTTEIDSAPWVTLSGGLVSRSADSSAPARVVANHGVGFDFFGTFGIELIAGRAFSPERDAVPDERPAAPANSAESPQQPGETERAPPDASGGTRPAASGSNGTASSRSESAASGAAENARKPGEPGAVRDTRAPNVPIPVIVDRQFVERFGFASPAAAVGQTLYFPDRMMKAFGGKAQPLTIVGVAENRTFVFYSVMNTAGTIYRLAPRARFVVARLARDDVTGALDGIDNAWRALAPNVAISRHFLDDYFEQAYSTFLHVERVLSGLALLAVAISVTGLFGMATLIAGRRMRELGVRKALGGSQRQMIGLLLEGFTRPVLAANVVAWPLAYMGARAYLNTFRAPIAITPLPFIAALAATLAIAWLAVVSQTLAAARARPAEVLRYE